MLDAADDEFRAQNFSEAVRLITEYSTSDVGNGKPLPWGVLVQLGISKYHMADYAGAVVDLRKAVATPVDEREALATAKFFLASTLLLSGSIDDSIAIFNDEQLTAGTHKAPTLLALGTALLAKSPSGNFDEIVRINNAILDIAPEKNDLSLIELHFSAYFNLGQVYALNGRSSIALENFDKALAIAPIESRSGILVRKSLVEGADKAGLISAAAKTILDGELFFKPGHSSRLRFSRDILASVLSSLAYLGDYELFDKVVEYARLKLFETPMNSFELLVRLLDGVLPGEREVENLNLFDVAICRYSDDEIEPATLETAYKRLALHGGDDYPGATANYLRRLSARLAAAHAFDEEDGLLLANIIYAQMRDKTFHKALRTVKTAYTVVEGMAVPSPLFNAIFLNQEFVIMQGLRDREGATAAAKRLIEAIDRADASALADTMNPARLAAVKYLRETDTNPLRKIGRNQRVTVRSRDNGKIFESKFKYV